MIHSEIKKLLGFDENEDDIEVLRKWNQRTEKLKKPCWLLKYCPYGELVEQFPLLPGTRKNAITHNAYLKWCLDEGKLHGGVPLDETKRKIFEKLVSEFDPNNYPEEIPIEFVQWECKIFGHICPVVFTAENVSESH